MPNPFGLDTDDDIQQLATANQLIQQIIDEPKPCPEGPATGSFLDSLEHSLPCWFPVSGYLEAAMQAAQENLDLLRSLAYSTIEHKSSFSPWSIAPLSRSVLVSTSRMIYVLCPETLDQRRRNTMAILKQDYNSLEMYLKDAPACYGPEYGTDHGAEIRNSLIDTSKELPGKNARDGEVVQSVIQIMSSWEPQELVPSADAMNWMWNTWSGAAHAYLWPLLVPGKGDRGRLDVVPGNWPSDFAAMAALTRLAQKRYYDALKPL